MLRGIHEPLGAKTEGVQRSRAANAARKRNSGVRIVREKAEGSKTDK